MTLAEVLDSQLGAEFSSTAEDLGREPAELLAEMLRNFIVVVHSHEAGARTNQETAIIPHVDMRYKVVLHESEEGLAVSCPALPGCWSQGNTEAEALANIHDAITEYLEAVHELTIGQQVREIEVFA